MRKHEGSRQADGWVGFPARWSKTAELAAGVHARVGIPAKCVPSMVVAAHTPDTRMYINRQDQSKSRSMQYRLNQLLHQEMETRE
ncbi:hypothetical protein SAMN05443635_10326 [Roseobacter denitrificans OCh 114]|nr:hypothetical protein SAMN05443635_10326 [Roseobacter denitrificans OCh 114]